MLVLVAVAATLIAPPPVARNSTAATAQARAIIRIVSGVTLRLGQTTNNGEAPPARDTMVRNASGGALQSAKLIEFQ